VELPILSRRLQFNGDTSLASHSNCDAVIFAACGVSDFCQMANLSQFELVTPTITRLSIKSRQGHNYAKALSD
jgi:hypothetical protein